MRPGSIVWLNLGPIVGHEQDGHRPALVISETPTRTMLVVVPLTSSPPRVWAHHAMAGPRVSTALGEQVRSIDRSRVTKVAGQADPGDLARVRWIVAELIGVRSHGLPFVP